MLVAAVALLAGCGGDSTTTPTGTTTTEPVSLKTPEAPVGMIHRGTPNGDLLRWNVSTDDAVMGYNLYRYDPDPLRFEAYRKLNAELLPTAKYTLSDLVAGRTYFFRVTAVNTDNLESAPSAVSRIVAMGQVEGRSGGLPQRFVDGEDGLSGNTE